MNIFISSNKIGGPPASGVKAGNPSYSLMGALKDLAKFIWALIPEAHLKTLENLNLALEWPKRSGKASAVEAETIDEAQIQEYSSMLFGLLEESVDDHKSRQLSVIFYSLSLLAVQYEASQEGDSMDKLVLRLLQKLMPPLLKIWNAKLVTGDVIEDWQNWPACQWELLLGLSKQGLGANGISRCTWLLFTSINIYLPLLDESRVDYGQLRKLHFDLRREDDISILLLDALDSDNALTRKQALFILKKIVAFSTRAVDEVNSASLSAYNEDSSERLFCWDPAKKGEWIEVWGRFFLIYETCQEPQVHILNPMLPMIRKFLEGPIERSLEEPWLGTAWWETLTRRAFKNDSVSVRKVMCEAILSLPVDELPRLKRSLDFLMGPLLQMCDVSSFYLPIDTSRLVSQFGELVVSFYARFLSDFDDDVEQAKAIRLYIERLTSVIKGPTPVIYLLQALLEMTNPVPALNEASLELLRKYGGSRSTFHNPKSRKLAKFQMLQILINLGDPKDLPYKAVATFLDFILPELDLTVSSAQFIQLTDWLEQVYGQALLEQSLANEVERYFREDVSLDERQARASRIATMAMLAMKFPGSFSRCCIPVYSFMARLGEMRESASFVVSAVLLFIRLDQAVRKITSNATDIVASLQLAERIYEWIDILQSVLVNVANEDLEYGSVMILIEGQELFMKAASEFSEKEPLIEIAEMHLFNLLEILLKLVDPSAHGDITFSQQLLKVALLQSMGTVLTVLKGIDFYEVKFFSSNHILAIFDVALDKPVSTMTAAQFDDWSELQISFVGAKWRLLGIVAGFFHHSAATAGLLDLEETFERCLVALESAKYRAVPAILNCLEILMPLLMAKNRKIPVRLLKESLNIGKELMRSHFDAPKWLDVYAHAFISFFFQPCLITGQAVNDESLHGPEGIVREAFWYVLNDLGPVRKGLVAQLSYNLAQAWATQSGCRQAYIQEIAQLLLYGPIRDQAEAKHTSLATFARHLGEGEEDEEEIGQDYMTRVHLITLLNHLDPTSDVDHQFAMALLGLFLDRALGIGIDAWEAKNVFPNAIQHRRRMRAWMATIILFKMVREADFVGGVEAKLWDCLAKEAMPSTRAFIEWFIAKGYLAFPAQTPHLLLRLNDPAKPASFVISSLLISYHVAIHIPSGSSDLIKTLFGYICPIFAEPNFQLRTTAIWVFSKLWTHSKHQDSLPEAYQLTYQRIKDNDNILKALAKLDAYPTHGRLDVIQDYNLDFIFYEFPLAIGIAVDELITHYAFRAASPTEGLVPITRLTPRPADQLISSSTSPLVAPPSGELAVTKAEEAEVDGLFKDFQQKISLWDLSLFEEELGDFRKTRELEKRKARLGETIVMASLIDKIPNLAGLSRTCEIFGVTRLTVPSAAVLQDPQFKAISMTSDKWLQIDPVKPEDIMAYVEARRAEGFRILAVEQTSLSVPLQNYSFPSKYLLILGNETSGVPPELLHLVDDCVEVPQFGMIRSLNVHVCGSIVVWESRKQLLSKLQAQL